MARRKKQPPPSSIDGVPVVALDGDAIDGMITVQLVVARGLVFASGQCALRGPYADGQVALSDAIRPEIEALLAAIAAHLGCEVFVAEEGTAVPRSPWDGPSPSAARAGRA